jgi:carbamoyltransferase
MDIAASIQAVTEEIVVRLARSIAKDTKQKNLCLAGGVALNCVANGKIHRAGVFDKIWIQPAAGDAGGAIGAALAAYHEFAQKPRVVGDRDVMQGAYLGPSYSQQEIEQRLTGLGGRYSTKSTDEVIRIATNALVDQQAVGWFQGRMEFGPRALGARSILGDPRSPTMQKALNMRIKYRESFRPFALAVLREAVSDWFEFDADSPYMLFVADVKPSLRRPMSQPETALFGIDKLNVVRSTIPAVTHVDYSARIQTVDRATNERFHSLLTAFRERTGCPILINTSFNVRGEPIVCTPDDAFRCFMGSEIELLVIGDCILHKVEQDPSLKLDYRLEFELD